MTTTKQEVITWKSAEFDDVLSIEIARETDQNGSPTGQVRAFLRCRIRNVGGGRYQDQGHVVGLTAGAKAQLKQWIETEALPDFNQQEGFPSA